MLKRRVVNFFLTIAVLLYILFEELVWERFAEPIVKYINSLKILSKLERYLQKINARLILGIFVTLFGAVEFLGIYAGAKFLEGEVVKGALIYAAKIPIAAWTFWLFRVTKDRLLEFEWFKKSYIFMTDIIRKITKSEIYTDVKVKSKKIKEYLKSKILQDRSSIKRRVKFIYTRLKEIFRS
jgi:hypothetical protein